QIFSNNRIIGKPLTYLGFEFYGDKTLIKSANLAKFYRRMIYAVKRKARYANKLSDENSQMPFIYRTRLKKLYAKTKLNSIKEIKRKKVLVYSREKRHYLYKFIDNGNSKQMSSNYFSYVNRASRIMTD